MEDKEKIINRVVGFLYDALDNFKSTMDEVNNSLGTLMDSLKKVEKDLQTLGVEPTREAPISSDQLAARIKAGASMSSKERLIGLLTGSPTSLESASTSVTPAPTITETVTAKPKGGKRGKPAQTPPPAVSIPVKPTSGPPKPMKGPPKAIKTAESSSAETLIPPMKPPSKGPPKESTTKPVAGPPKPMKGPPKATQPAEASSTAPPKIPSMKPPPVSAKPPIMKPPTTAAPNTPTAAPTDSAQSKPGGSIIGLRDEMLKELKRLKSIMKGG